MYINNQEGKEEVRFGTLGTNLTSKDYVQPHTLKAFQIYVEETENEDDFLNGKFSVVARYNHGEEDVTTLRISINDILVMILANKEKGSTEKNITVNFNEFIGISNGEAKRFYMLSSQPLEMIEEEESGE